MLIVYLCFFRERKKFFFFIWLDLNIKEVEFLLYDIDGYFVLELKYDSNNFMKSIKDGRFWDT